MISLNSFMNCLESQVRVEVELRDDGADDVGVDDRTAGDVLLGRVVPDDFLNEQLI